MGCFGYICKGCDTQIVGKCFGGGELCILKHVRHGEVLGECTGHYNEYGTVIEENEETGFRSEEGGINSHDEICKSEFDLKDSRYYYQMIDSRIVDGKITSFDRYKSDKHFELFIKYKDDKELLSKKLDEFEDSYEELMKEFKKFPLVDFTAKSGIVAWHVKCHNEATEEQRVNLTPSKHDPNQSWGDVRDEFR
jgi:hypothetical protein